MSASIVTEADVEFHVLTPLMTDPSLLGIPAEHIKGKTHLASADIDKKSGKSHGYFPDFSIWFESLPIVIVEAKSPLVATEVGFREAGLYAHHLNKQYRSGLNPAALVLATNGITVLAGSWDANPSFEADYADITPGSVALDELRRICGYPALLSATRKFQTILKPPTIIAPYTIAGGGSIINSKVPPNTFAAPLSPVLRKYFTSKQQNKDKEIYADGYINSLETESYDQVLELFMKERLVELRGSLSETLKPSKRSEPKLTKAVKKVIDERPLGQLQLITGGVGSGKSLFIRRYKELLQPADQKSIVHWAFIDFNNAPKSLSEAERWICESFINSFNAENDYDASDSANWSQVFAVDLAKRKAIYEEVALSSESQAVVLKASDLREWAADYKRLASGLSRFVTGDKRETIVVVMDNVDKLGAEEQLGVFGLSLWFMELTRAFVILNLRDDTYERFKGEPPLDTYRSGVTFHISPPRFIEVVRRRLELSANYLAKNAPEKLEYTTKTGLKIKYPETMIGEFLKEIYAEIFENQPNSSRMIQGLAGRDVRKALDIFESILRSGHLSEEAITSKVRGAGLFEIKEDTVLKSLMRGEYRFASNHSGFITNLFWCEPSSSRPTNFLNIDILYWLYTKRKERGGIGLEGYFSVKMIAEALQLRGFVSSDIFGAINFVLKGGLVEADHFHPALTSEEDSIKITYSGFIHLRFLVDRLEYLYGLLPTTNLFNRRLAEEVAVVIDREAKFGDVGIALKVQAVNAFYQNLKSSFIQLKASFPEFGAEGTGSHYVMGRIDRSLALMRGARNLGPDINIMDAV